MMSPVDEPIQVVAYDPNWVTMFKREAALLRGILADAIVGIEHIGSTAVPDLPAKPIIDIQIGVAGPPAYSRVTPILEEAGYASLGEAGVSGRLYFRKRHGPNYNAHVMQMEGEHWRNNLAMRNYLRRNADAASAYADVKRSAAAVTERLVDYSQRKSAFMEKLLRQAVSTSDGGYEKRQDSD